MAILMQPTTGYDVGVERNEGRHADEPGNRVESLCGPARGSEISQPPASATTFQASSCQLP
jgi:hypothetical protein